MTQRVPENDAERANEFVRNLFLGLFDFALAFALVWGLIIGF